MHLFFVLVLFLMAGFKANAMEEKEREVKTISDISWFCAQLAKKVSEQPLFDGEKIADEKLKVLPLRSLDAKICDILTDNAKKVLGEDKAWHIHHCGPLITADDEWIESGIMLYIFDAINHCSLETLEKTYKNIITLSQLDWKLVRSEDHPIFIFEKKPEDWNIFIKKKSLIEEDRLIGTLCTKFNLRGTAACYGYEWLKKAERNDEIYLCVKKDAQPEFDEIFGFKYQ